MKKFFLSLVIGLLLAVSASAQVPIYTRPQGGLGSGTLPATAFPLLAPDGATTTPSYAFSAQPSTGIYRSGGSRIVISPNSTDSLAIGGNNVILPAAGTLNWAVDGSIGTSAFDVMLVRDAAAILALKNTTNAQTFRVYGTTTGTKYVALSHDATNGKLDTASASGSLVLGGNAVTIVTNGTAPTPGACGTSPAVAGNNNAMFITIGTGGAATSCAATFSGTGFPTNAPVCVAQSDTDKAAIATVTTTTTVTFSVTTPFTASSHLHVLCFGR